MTRAITKKELYDEDWQTQLARGYENIPANIMLITYMAVIRRYCIMEFYIM